MKYSYLTPGISVPGTNNMVQITQQQQAKQENRDYSSIEDSQKSKPEGFLSGMRKNSKTKAERRANRGGGAYCREKDTQNESQSQMNRGK